jgi:hypothetical protein
MCQVDTYHSSCGNTSTTQPFFFTFLVASCQLLLALALGICRGRELLHYVKVVFVFKVKSCGA